MNGFVIYLCLGAGIWLLAALTKREHSKGIVNKLFMLVICALLWPVLMLKILWAFKPE